MTQLPFEQAEGVAVAVHTSDDQWRALLLLELMFGSNRSRGLVVDPDRPHLGANALAALADTVHGWAPTVAQNGTRSP